MPTIANETMPTLGRGVVSIGKSVAVTQDRELLLAVSKPTGTHRIT